MNDPIKSFERLQEIMFIGLQDKPDAQNVSILNNEVEFEYGTIFEAISDEYMKPVSEPRVSLGYYEEKLFGVKNAVQKALGIDREKASDESIISDFEHYSYLAKKGLPR